MYRTEEDSLDLESLREELCRKEDDLLRAAHYGKSLLEENGQLKREKQALLEERNNLEELLQSQRTEHQRGLHEARQAAEAHITHLEHQVQQLKESLLKDRAQLAAAKDEHGRITEELRAENGLLKEEMEKLKALCEEKTDRNQLLELRRSLEDSEEEQRKLAFHITALQAQLQECQGKNSSLVEEVSILTHTCDQLLDQLENSKEAAECWEKQSTGKSMELEARTKELMDSQELVKQLQIQVDQQNFMDLTPVSITSGMSLFDEFSSCLDRVNTPEDLSSASSDVCEELIDTDEDQSQETVVVCTSLATTAAVVAPLPLETKLEMSLVGRGETLGGWGEPTDGSYQCDRCLEFQEKLAKQQIELSSISEQLMKVVGQKFQLQLQLEAWQSDMATVVDQNIHRELKREKKPLDSTDKSAATVGSQGNLTSASKKMKGRGSGSWFFS